MRKQFFIILCLFNLALLAPLSSLRADNTQIPVQGYLTDASGNVVNATTDMVFQLYTAATGGTAAWSSGTLSVAVSNGFYSTTLGTSSNALPSLESALYLGITVGTDSEMLPRNEFSAVPFALTCSNCSSLVSVSTTDASNTITGSEETVNTVTIPANTLNNTGEVLHVKTYGTSLVSATSSQILSVKVDSTSVGSISYNGDFSAPTSTWIFEFDMVRTGTSTAEVSLSALESSPFAASTFTNYGITALTGLDFTSSFAIDITCNLQSDGDCTSSGIITRVDR
ncbi:MAG: hypothetical protein COX62_07880 [Deltaproteobacteria bacterium CG_4_10_14_0_2_um_filter_43_8]|nr:MAG: hypothetical protein COV43_05305 [Deltaproteobacteria bacterium CG11_big_fil_rev_8_21_14_0_20_42_23]PJA18869.1 MAG: hypothetical protein COX62_07880 [Deltaproteobacteria bacterium CG_4_10_14_0_2_um_filter_43_8]PJC64009.1 MAG: hypothetical protein CO021_06280 [Deltaproteobacteria bacterium CG_4_9_14_0_2_um_filter_42_21]